MPANIPLLIQKYLSNSCSPEEVDELVQLLANPVHEQTVDEILLQQLAKEYQPITEGNQELNERLQKRLQEILRQPPIIQMPVRENVRQFPWKKIAIAASIIATIGIAAYFVISTKEKSPAVVASPDQQHDVPAPDRNRAQIKLADGTIVYLDSAGNGELVKQGNVVVTKTADGKIVYSGSSSSPEGEAGVRFNTLTNPRGSKVQPLTLSDGTKVWLNAESSITYPTAFAGNERKITMTGEAYFEVAKDAKKKFIVDANGTSTEVLGTHFNINAYNDEQETKVTLLEGSVNVIARSDAGAPKQSKSVKLTPGQQAVLTHDSRLTTNGSPDIDQVLAWKNGLFKFGGTDVETVMKQIARWYDVEIIYQGPKPIANFRGTISRQENVTEVLKMLELTKAVKFKIDNKKIVVTK